MLEHLRTTCFTIVLTSGNVEFVHYIIYKILYNALFSRTFIFTRNRFNVSMNLYLILTTHNSVLKYLTSYDSCYIEYRSFIYRYPRSSIIYSGVILNLNSRNYLMQIELEKLNCILFWHFTIYSYFILIYLYDASSKINNSQQNPSYFDSFCIIAFFYKNLKVIKKSSEWRCNSTTNFADFVNQFISEVVSILQFKY